MLRIVLEHSKKFLLITLMSCITSYLYADKVVLKNGNTMEGIVVEEYPDRIILSVPYGRSRLYKKQIADIIYDRAEQNFLKMGNNYFDEGDIDKAIEYYKKALKIKPDFEDAKDAIAGIEDKRKKIEQRKKEAIKNRQEKIKQREREILKKQQEQVRKLRETLGIEIEKHSDDIGVVSVYPETPASKAGIKSGDIIISIWDVSVKYKNTDKVIELLLGEKGSSVTLTIERQLSPIRKRIRWHEKSFVGIGISLQMEEKRLIVTDVLHGQPGDIAGLKKNDHITAVEGKSIRYMTLKEATRNMAGEELTPLRLTINRKIKVLRGGSGSKLLERQGDSA